MERRQTPRRDWVIGRDEVGRAVLEWGVDQRRAMSRDSQRRTEDYDVLSRLDVPELALEDDGSADQDGGGFNPYDRTLPTKRRR